MPGFGGYLESVGPKEKEAPCFTRYTLEELRRASILVVDDVEFNIMMIAEIFKSFGFYNLHFAYDGEDALAKTLEIKPDLVILDILMPRLDGYGYIERLRSDETFRHMRDLPVLVLTSANGEYEKRRTFKYGATDFVSKPAEKYELIARSVTHIDRRLMIKKLYTEGKRMEMELDQARAMQNVILPTERSVESVEKAYGISISSLFRTSSELGGDFWGLEPLDDDMLAFYIADFSGHGIASALNTFRLHTLIQGKNELRTDPAAYVKYLNVQLCHLLPAGQFATMFYAVYDKRDRSVRYAGAASTFPIVARKNDGSEVIEVRGFPLGATLKAEYETHVISLEKGDLLFLYSDALIETPVARKNGVKEPIDEEEIAKRLQLLRSCSKEDKDFIEKLRREIKTIFYSEFRGAPGDDLTILGVVAL
ncbi:MAG: fused response regulator/phosphatase [Rickettsiales bacterium]